jgi:hypothetical protein
VVAVAIAAVTAAVAAACTVPPPLPPEVRPGYQRYVALGDSWTAAPLIGLPVGEPLTCFRSANNYPQLVARKLRVAQVVDASCGDATTEELTEPQNTKVLGLLGVTAPPQFDALTPDTDLVTIGMGGNDVGLPGWVLGCANLLDVPLGPPPFGQPCEQVFTAGGVDQLSGAIADVRPRIEAALAGIQLRSPRARVLVVGYPSPFPADGAGCRQRWPISDSDAAWLASKIAEFNAMLAGAAEEAGAEFVDTTPSHAGHDACRPPGIAWINGLTIDPDGVPFHPTSRSAAATAEVVAAAARPGT